MKAEVIHGYGDSTVFKYEDVAMPEPGAAEVLVKVHYASVNPFDCKVRAGYMKDNMPLNFPAIFNGLGVNPPPNPCTSLKTIIKSTAVVPVNR